MDGRQRLVWEAHDRPALAILERDIRREARTEWVAVHLLSYEQRGVTQTAPDSDRALSRLTAELSEGTATTSPDIEQIAHEVTDGVTDPREQAARLYAWTRDSIRYCAIAVALGGWIPHPAKDTERLRYGDCKDKANLLRALLAVKGISSRAVAIYADDQPVAFTVPSLGSNFNHEILSVDFADGSVVVDPTTRTVPFGALPPHDEGRWALPSSSPGSALVFLPRAPVDDNVLTSAFTLDGTAAGADADVLHGTVVVQASGDYADTIRDLLLNVPPGRQGEALASLFGVDELTDVAVDDAAPPVWPTPVAARGTIVVRGRLGQGLTVLHPHDVLPGRLPVLEDRIPHAVELLAPRRSVDVVRLRVGHRGVEALPRDVDVDEPFARYALTVALEGDTIVIRRTIEWRASSVPAETYEAARTFLARAHRAEAHALALAPVVKVVAP